MVVYYCYPSYTESINKEDRSPGWHRHKLAALFKKYLEKKKKKVSKSKKGWGHCSRGRAPT
jgi:hypothetical protein